VITTVEQLDALPAGTPITDVDGDVWRKLLNGNWSMRPGRSFGATSAYLLETYAPLGRTVPDAELRMTRCCGSGCPNTTPLPVGASWLCPDHGGESHEIKRGNRP